MQLVGPPDGEPLLLALAAQLEDATRLAGAAPAGARVSELLALATDVAHEAGAGLREAFSRLGDGGLAIHAKSTPTDLVSEADVATERRIRARLEAARPDDAIMGEEGDDRPGTSGLRWVVDPLDGTVNFLFGIPQWCVSIAVEDAEGALAGVVYDPMRDETFAATRDGAATLDGAPLGPPARDELATALVATGFGYDADVREAQAAGAGAAAPAGARRPPARRRRARPRVGRGGPRRRLLRARRPPLGRRGGRPDLRARRARRARARAARRRPPPGCWSRRRRWPTSCRALVTD